MTKSLCSNFRRSVNVLRNLFLISISFNSLQVACGAAVESGYIFNTPFEAISSFYENGQDNVPICICDVADLVFIRSVIIQRNIAACFVAHKSKEINGWISGPECEKRISDIPRIEIKIK